MGEDVVSFDDAGWKGKGAVEGSNPVAVPAAAVFLGVENEDDDHLGKEDFFFGLLLFSWATGAAFLWST